jgi:hypothetical protein
LKTSLFNFVYRVARPLVGIRAALFIAEIAPALLFAGIPLLLYWWLLSGVPTNNAAATDVQMRLG